MPRVSVIIPTYNRAHLVRRAIQSVLEQTYADYEIIVVDDGSTDDTAAAVATISAPAGRLRYIYQDNRGRSAARNAGIRAAGTPYVAFLDSDDVFLPEKLGVQIGALDRQPEYGMAYGYYLSEDELGRPLPGRGHPSGELSGWIYPALLLIQGSLITTPTVMVRREVLRQAGEFDETLHMCEDLDLWRRIARRHPVLQIRTPLARVTYRTAEPLALEEKLRARTRYYHKALADDTELRPAFRTQLWAEMYWHYGSVALLNSRRKQGLVWLRRSFQHSPRHFAIFAGQFVVNHVSVLWGLPRGREKGATQAKRVVCGRPRPD